MCATSADLRTLCILCVCSHTKPGRARKKSLPPLLPFLAPRSENSDSESQAVGTPPCALASLPADTRASHGERAQPRVGSILALRSPGLRGFVRTAVPSKRTVPSTSQAVEARCRWGLSEPRIRGAQQRPGPAAEAGHGFWGKRASWRRQSPLENWLQSI